ncbi:hypothetical protein BJX96DRAFT_757 [Aspergillus floccosus]
MTYCCNGRSFCFRFDFIFFGLFLAARDFGGVCDWFICMGCFVLFHGPCILKRFRDGNSDSQTN